MNNLTLRIAFAFLVAIFSLPMISVGQYTFSASSGTYTSIAAGTDVNSIEVDAALSTAIPIGFSFEFDGTAYTQVKMSSDGWMTFNTGATMTEKDNDLDGIAATFQPLVAPLWDDLDGTDFGGTAKYETTGSSPNRVFTAQWENWEWNYDVFGNATISFQVRLYETTNVIEFVYRQESGAIENTTGGASIGLSGNSSFLSLDGTGASPSASSSTETDNLSTKPATGQVYTFTPPPVPNDNCAIASSFPINSATYPHAPTTQTGDISLASAGDDLAAFNSNGNTCDGATIATGEEDMWYSFTTPAAAGNYYVELAIDFTGVAGPIHAVIYDDCTTGTVIGCSTISADGTLAFNVSNSTALTNNSTYNVKILKPTGSAATTFTIAGQVIAENNTCEVMQGVSPGYDVTNTNNDLDFNFASASGVHPTGVTGNDLWYRFDPVSGLSPDGTGLTTWSSSAKVTIGGLDAGEQVTLVVYKGNANNADNCNDLTGDFLETLVVTGNGIVTISCLDVLHTTALGGYLIRVVQTAGGTVIDNGLIRVEPDNAGPYNDQCGNIWDGTMPINLGVEDATTFFNPYYLPIGHATITYRTSQTQNASDCDPDIASSNCNGSQFPNTGLESDDRDVWMVFQAGSDPTGMTFRYGAAAGNDGVLYVYSACADASLIDCSGSLIGQGCAVLSPCPGSEWSISGLTTGQFYLLRIKPAPTNTTFEYSLDISLSNGGCAPNAGYMRG